MKILKTAQIKEGDHYTILHEPISSLDLMERASTKAFQKILEVYPEKKKYVVFAGSGNNGGDGLVIARLLAGTGKRVKLFFVKFTDNVTPDFHINYIRLKEQKIVEITELSSSECFPVIETDEIIVDALFGSGLTRSITGFPAEVIKKMNESSVDIISVDMPSGLFGEESPDTLNTIVKATLTLTFQFPKLSFMFPECQDFVGRFEVIDIGIHQNYIQKTLSLFYYLTDEDIKLKCRKKFSHKGNYGHALIISGSYGKAGASVLAVKATQRAGAGLVSALVPSCNYQILQTSSPETMLFPDSNKKFVTELPDLSSFSAVGIGPGIGFNKKTKVLLKHLIVNYRKTIVFDADALTILSENKELLDMIPNRCILTPHFKEFERLAGKSDNHDMRLQKLTEFAVRYNVIVVLKGAHSAIALPDGRIFFNSTGNAGMATGGSGDVLTGIIVSLAAQGYEPAEAAIIGTYIHGLSGDFAKKTVGQNALIASDIICFLPEAFKYFEKFQDNCLNF